MIEIWLHYDVSTLQQIERICHVLHGKNVLDFHFVIENSLILV